MPWRCPACETQIHHSEHESEPRLGTRYRCHICRLELMLDPEKVRLAVAPMQPDEPNKKNRKVA
jgi:hypothetical protein